METENITLKPIPPKTLVCRTCRETFFIYSKDEWVKTL